MKTLFFIKALIVVLLLLFNCISVSAQVDITTAKKGDYFKNDSLRIIEGRWMGINNKNDTIRVLLKFREKVAIGPCYIDCVTGWHEYTENGIIQSSSMNDTFNLRNASIYIYVATNKRLMFFLADENKSYGTAMGSLAFNPSFPDELIWKVETLEYSEQGRTYLEGTAPPPPRERSKLTVTKEWKMIRVKN